MKLASAVLVAATAILGGCAAPQQPPLSLNPEAVGTQSGRIGVVMTAVPKPDTQFPGAGCLLCVAAANAAHTTLTGYTQTLPAEDVSNLKNEVAALIRKKGGNVTVIAEELKIDDLPDATTKGTNIAVKDYSPLKKRYDVDKLVVLSVTTMGIERPFSAYIPTGDPKGVLAGQGYLVNLNNNTYEWYQNVRSIRAADGKWDEPPKFPGLTNAYFQAIEMGMDEFKKPFSR
jgi:hypothetical protein